MKVYNEEQTEISDAKNAITVKHLLTHTAGIIYGGAVNPLINAFRKRKFLNPAQRWQIWHKNSALFPSSTEPGEDWTYGVSTDVLGYLVEVVSGMPFEEFLQTRLFAPLGMVDTAFSVPLEKIDRFAALYQRSSKGEKGKEKKIDDAKSKEKDSKVPKTQK